MYWRLRINTLEFKAGAPMSLIGLSNLRMAMLGRLCRAQGEARTTPLRHEGELCGSPARESRGRLAGAPDGLRAASALWPRNGTPQVFVFYLNLQGSRGLATAPA